MTAENPDIKDVDLLFARLVLCIEAENPNTVQQVSLDLSTITNERGQVPDELLERMLTFLQTKTVLESPVAASVLGFVDLSVFSLTKVQKRRCLAVLKTLADQFADGDAICLACSICDRLLIAVV
jgi:hypothetical protein